MNDPLKELGTKIRARREGLGLSTDDLSKESRVSTKHIKNIEIANRNELPEPAYLIGFLGIILKTLKLEQELLENFKEKEGDHIVQQILNENQEILTYSKQKRKSFSLEYFKIYHLYILAILILVSFLFISIKKSNFVSNQMKQRQPQELEPVILYIHDDNYISKKESYYLSLDNIVEALLNSSTEPIVDETRLESSGSKTLSIKALDYAWIQVFAITQNKVLFEGTISPETHPLALSLNDDKGFIVSTGNAGGVEVNIGEGSYKLGEAGQVVKVYLPKEVKEPSEEVKEVPMKEEGL